MLYVQEGFRIGLKMFSFLKNFICMKKAFVLKKLASTLTIPLVMQPNSYVIEGKQCINLFFDSLKAICCVTKSNNLLK